MLATHVEEWAASVGRGLAAGLAGTVVMTGVQWLEIELRGSSPSTAPAEAAEKVFEVEPSDPRAEERLSNLMHFAYGTAWGAVRGALQRLGMGGRAATHTHLMLVWGAGLAMLPALGLAPPVTRWSSRQVARDFLHHAVYAVTTGVVYDFLDRSRRVSA
ncbi:MAG: hypothetical protein ACOCV4_01585 [Myxococcota bacterium]